MCQKMAGMDSGKVVEAFGALEMRVGTIVEALTFPQARKPAYRLRISFGELGDGTPYIFASGRIAPRTRTPDLLAAGLH